MLDISQDRKEGDAVVLPQYKHGARTLPHSPLQSRNSIFTLIRETENTTRISAICIVSAHITV